jgi:hypothetical protein
MKSRLTIVIDFEEDPGVVSGMKGMVRGIQTVAMVLFGGEMTRATLEDLSPLPHHSEDPSVDLLPFINR